MKRWRGKRLIDLSLLLIGILVTMFALTGCSNYQSNQPQKENQIVDNSRTEDDVQATELNEKESVPTDKKMTVQEEIINSVLSTTIRFELTDGSACILDKVTMKNWVRQDEEGNQYIDIDSNLPIFLQELDKKATQANATTEFEATGIGTILVNVPTWRRAKIDIEKEIQQIKSELGTAQTYNREPIYERIMDLTDVSSYVEIDITRQTVWMYLNGECILETPCVTGMEGKHDTPTGIYYLDGKTTNVTLTDRKTYWSFVNFWMPFYKGYGLHDASGWRKEYGGEIFKTNGSHGCVNLPFSAAKTIYTNIDFSMPIIIYKS